MRLFWYHLKEQFFADQQRWSLWLPVFFGTGIALYFALPLEPSKWITLGVAEFLILLAILWRFHPERLVALLVPAFILLGFAVIQIRTIWLSSYQAPIPSDILYLSGRVKSTDYNQRGSQRLILDRLRDFEEKPLSGQFRVSLRPQTDILHSGQCVEMIAKLMPRAKASLPGGYQFDRKSFYLGLSGSGYAASRVLPVDCPEPPSLTDKITFAVDKLRRGIISHIKGVLPPAEASVAAAVIAGEQGGVPRSQIQNYRDSGLAHFLSISGLHMSMITGLMFFFIRLLIALIPPLALRCDSKKISAFFAIGIGMVYLLISGAAVPAQRAFIMTFIVLLGVLTDRRAISMKTIAWAAFIVLLVSPEALIGASFQMSFAAVIALIAFYERFAGTLHRFLNGNGTVQISLLTKIFRVTIVYILGILISDLVASLATMPFSIYHFNRIALYTTLANLMAGPVIGFVIMPFTLLSLVAMPFGLDYWPLQVVGFGISQVNEITKYVSSLPSAGWQLLSMPTWGLGLIVFGGLWLAIWQTPWRNWGWFLIVGGILSIASVKTPDVLVNPEADLFAVKAADGTMVVLPKRGDNFTKSVWLDKMASPPLSQEQTRLLRQIWLGQKTIPKWLDMTCNKKSCLYRKRVGINKSGGLSIDGKGFNPFDGEGAAIYLDTFPARIVTVREYIGNRHWN